MLTIDHRGFSPIPPSITSISLDATLRSELKWDIHSLAPHTLWELEFDIQTLAPSPLASYQLAVRHFAETIWEPHKENTLGAILYKGKVPPFEIEAFAEYLHHLAAYLPDEVPPFALFDCAFDPMLFSKEIFSHIHLGFTSGEGGVLQWGEETLRPLRHDASLGIALPLREKGLQFDSLDRCLAEIDRPYRLIAEPHITEEWDELSELIIFPDLISPWGMRMVQGFEAAGGKISRYVQQK